MKKWLLSFVMSVLGSLVALQPGFAGKPDEGPQIKAPTIRQGAGGAVKGGKGPAGQEGDAEEEQTEMLPRGKGLSGSSPIEPVPTGDPNDASSGVKQLGPQPEPPEKKIPDADESVAPVDADAQDQGMKRLGPQPEPPEKPLKGHK